MTLVLACRHEIKEGEMVDGKDAEGWRFLVRLGEIPIAMADLANPVWCEECGKPVKIVGVQ